MNAGSQPESSRWAAVKRRSVRSAGSRLGRAGRILCPSPLFPLAVTPKPWQTPSPPGASAPARRHLMARLHRPVSLVSFVSRSNAPLAGSESESAEGRPGAPPARRRAAAAGCAAAGAPQGAERPHPEALAVGALPRQLRPAPPIAANEGCGANKWLLSDV